MNAVAKGHVNGLFTEALPLERGVSIGDPLYPSLFILSSQPLMRILEDMKSMGELVGLRINRGASLSYQLFADDTTLFI